MSSRSLLAFVAAADTFVVGIGLPFELYCRHLLASNKPGVAVLMLMLVANGSMLAVMACSMFGTAVLAKRTLELAKKEPRKP